MKKLMAISVAVVFAALLCQAAFCEGERPARATGERMRMTAEQREQLRPLMERLREINQNEQLRDVAVEARQDEKVQNAFQKVTKVQEALREAQQKAQAALEEAILTIAKKKENKELINLLKERKEILEKLPPQFRGRFFGGGLGFPARGGRLPGAGPGRTGRGGRRPAGGAE